MEEIAKLILILGFIALFIRLLREGPEGPKRWWRAKFLGEAS